MLDFARTQWNKIALAFIVLFGGVLAILGTSYGLPILLHPNEWTIVEPAMRMVENRTFVPDVFYRPDHLLIIMNAVIYRAMMFLFGINEVADFTVASYLIARLLTAVFFIGSILMAYKTGKFFATLRGENDNICKCIGIACAFLFAFLPIFVRETHYATPDIPTVFFMLLFIYAALRYMEKPTLRNVLFMSMVTGVFITIKYPGAILIGMIALCVFAVSVRDRLVGRFFRHGVVSAGGMFATIFIISPVLFTRFDAVWEALAAEARDTHLGYDGLGWLGNIWFYFNIYVLNSGIILLVFFAMGIFAILRKPDGDIDKSKEEHGISGFLKRNNQLMIVLPLFSGFAFWLALSYMSLHWERWALPMYVSPLLISGIGVVKGYDYIKSLAFFEKKRKLCIGIFAAFLFISALNLMAGSSAGMTEFLLTDTRIASREFTDENNITPENTLYENYTTFEITFHGDMLAIYHAFDRVGDSFQFRYDHIDYIIMSSNMFGRYRADPNRYADQIAVYDFVESNFIEIKRFEPETRSTSAVEILNIYHSIDYLIRAVNNGLTGNTLIFFEVN